MRIFTGNLSADTNEERLKAAFNRHGTVECCLLPKDKHTGAYKGFAIVEMKVDAEANAAIAALNGSELNGNKIEVKESKPKAHK